MKWDEVLNFKITDHLNWLKLNEDIINIMIIKVHNEPCGRSLIRYLRLHIVVVTLTQVKQALSWCELGWVTTIGTKYIISNNSVCRIDRRQARL